MLITNCDPVLKKITQSLQQIEQAVAFVEMYLTSHRGFDETHEDFCYVGKIDNYLIGLTKDGAILEMGIEELDTKKLKDTYDNAPVLEKFDGVREVLDEPVTLSLPEMETCPVMSKVLRDRKSLSYQELRAILIFRFGYYDNYRIAESENDNFYFIGAYSASHFVFLSRGDNIVYGDRGYADPATSLGYPEKVNADIKAWLRQLAENNPELPRGSRREDAKPSFIDELSEISPLLKRMLSSPVSSEEVLEGLKA
jgi:hypothetical protein